MKKVIIVLFLAIGFVMMILISWMRFQTQIHFQSTKVQQHVNPKLVHSEYDNTMDFHSFFP